MQAPTKHMHSWLASDDATTGIEYALLATAIAMAIITVVTQIGTSLGVIFTDVAGRF